MDMNDDRELAAFTREIVARVKKDLLQSKTVPATVAEIGTDGMISVFVDGDEDGVATRAEPLTGDLLRVAQRVMVLFQPPRACFVIGVIQSGFGGLAKALDHAPADTDWPFAPPDGTMATDSTTGRLYVRIANVWMYEALT